MDVSFISCDQIKVSKKLETGGMGEKARLNKNKKLLALVLNHQDTFIETMWSGLQQMEAAVPPYGS